VWFQDEARVGQRGTVSRIWAQKGTRPRIVQQQQFTAAYIFGAICPKESKTVWRAILPHEILGSPVAKYSFTYGANHISPSTPLYLSVWYI